MEILIENKTGRIHYGFGADYLPDWGITQALREVYQNFIDYGEYSEEVVTNGDMVIVKLTNGWQPESLEYLRIGNTRKSSPNAIGHHGEGLKMAFLILLREKYSISILTNKYSIYPEWYTDTEIGECFSLGYEVHDMYEIPYTLEFTCSIDDFTNFHDNLITDDDIIFSHPYGDIVSKEAGNIYSGGLFVAKVNNVSKAYNIKPEHLPLDRDRSVPRSFDVNWNCSKINEAYGKFTTRDLSYSDTLYINRVPEDIKSSFKPRLVGNNIEFTYKDDKKVDQVVKNSNIADALKNDSFFAAAIKKLKRFVAKQLGLYELLVEFQQKHVHTSEALQDFDLILSRVKK